MTLLSLGDGGALRLKFMLSLLHALEAGSSQVRFTLSSISSRASSAEALPEISWISWQSTERKRETL